MADSSIQPPYLDPTQYPSFLDAQRKQQIAQMLMSSLQQSASSPNPTTGVSGAAGAVTPRRGIMQSVAPLVDALMAGKANKDAQTATQQYYHGLYGGGQQPTGPGAGIISPDAPPEAQAAAQAVTNAPATGGLVRPSQPQNPMLPPGMTPGNAQAMLSMMGPEKYAETFIAPNWKTPEIVANLRAAHIDPNSPQGIAIQQAAINKATNIPPTLVKGNETALDPTTRLPFFTGPDQGINTTWGPNGPTQAPIPGAEAAEQGLAAAKTAGAEGQKPIKLGTDANGRDIYGFPTPPGPAGAAPPPTGAAPPKAPGPALLNATAPGQTASPAVKTAQEAGAKGGQDYSTELSKNSNGALEIRRGLSELRNLATQATPSALNEGKLKMGSWMIAAGMDPKAVSAKLGVDIGALQAAEHNQGGLAVSAIHGMTSRGTNFDLETFMRQNPNLDMSSPEAFNRVADYMDSKAQQTIDMQKDFAAGLKTGSWGSPDQWEANHTAHWNDLQNAQINAGKFNSSNANSAAGPRAYASEAEAQAAAKRGEIKSGDKIKIGNQSGTWH